MLLVGDDVSFSVTTAQTVGPFFRIGFERLYGIALAPEGAGGERMTIIGRVLDGDGVGVPDAVLELWQANAEGKYAHAEGTQDKALEQHFTGFGRVPTDAQGRFCFSTIKPGRVPDPDGKLQAPHIVVSIFMRGLLRRLVTRIYFTDEPANAFDFALARVETSRRTTLMARPSTSGTLEWNVVLQGENETVFFDC